MTLMMATNTLHSLIVRVIFLSLSVEMAKTNKGDHGWMGQAGGGGHSKVGIHTLFGDSNYNITIQYNITHTV